MKLNINVDHIATLREARGVRYPDPVEIALLAEGAGVSGITVHLREDRRHIQDRDVFRLRKVVKTKLNLEMAAANEIVNIALKVRPDLATIVPEKRKELTTEGGLDVIANSGKLKKVISKLKNKGILVSLFVDPLKKQIKEAVKVNADFIELHTGRYADAKTNIQMQKEFEKIVEAAKFAKKLGLMVNAGHGLNYENVKKISRIREIKELSIGHSIISRTTYVGIKKAVYEMLSIIQLPEQA